MLWLRGVAAAPHEQQMSCAFHETGVPRVGLLQLREMTGELMIDPKGCRIPPTVGDEPIMENIEAAQILDVEIGSKAISQLTCGKEVKPRRNTTAIGELDLASVETVIEFEVTRLLNRIDEDRWSAAD